MSLLLGIETSCDETAAAVVRDGREILTNVVASQVDLHAQYGGVFPELASRAHVEAITAVVNEALAQAGTSLAGMDAIAVTRGPGLVGSLLVGVNYAKGLALGAGLPLLGINHLEGHVYSLWPGMQAEPDFPLLVLIVSGGHTELLLMTGHGCWRGLGGTRDDAAGEAFDKVGRILGLPFPGGPHVERVARDGDPGVWRFPRAWLDDSDDFSFSGLKTAVLRAATVDPNARRPQLRADVSVADLAAGFQAALVEVLARKTARAAERCGAGAILVAGGVSANQALRTALRQAGTLPLLVPPPELCTDNAAMIAAAAHWRWQAGQRDGLDMEVLPRWPLGAPHSFS
ncbi:MAG: tRNA (adenosine(37)-N6)-threonylcarbamoyltransferase complex transferase subunit TsaD [Anaerolineaceae bacterium]|nr:tRNA (adenosine(37)-N6)-threonylcarbamoyltransferase complex transferase subunit TsaD [Anaerolineaceae bacterium]